MPAIPKASVEKPVSIEELNHVAIHVQDVPRSVAFYQDVLRLPSRSRPAFDFPGAWFALGAAQELHLIGDRREEVHSHSRGNHFALRVTSLDDWIEHFASIGFTHPPPRTRPDGARQLFVNDPDGYWIELVQPMVVQ
jgi:lactoylglutathione lyase